MGLTGMNNRPRHSCEINTVRNSGCFSLCRRPAQRICPGMYLLPQLINTCECACHSIDIHTWNDEGLLMTVNLLPPIIWLLPLLQGCCCETPHSSKHPRQITCSCDYGALNRTTYWDARGCSYGCASYVTSVDKLWFMLCSFARNCLNQLNETSPKGP